MKKEDPEKDHIIDQLKAVNPDDLSPREAWNMISDLCEEVNRNGK